MEWAGFVLALHKLYELHLEFTHRVFLWGSFFNWILLGACLVFDGRVCICLIYFAGVAVWLNPCFDSKGYQVKETLGSRGGGEAVVRVFVCQGWSHYLWKPFRPPTCLAVRRPQNQTLPGSEANLSLSTFGTPVCKCWWPLSINF